MKLDAKTTAVLTLDFQKGILDMVTGADLVVPNAALVVEACRQKQFPIVHVGLGFECGYPEIGNIKSSFSFIKERGVFLKGSESTQFHKSLVAPGDIVVYKHRVSAFSENSLHMILRSQGIETLIFFGVATSGITLSTLRRAFDLDFKCVIIKDACFDRDEEVHRVLTEKIFVTQATVMTAKGFVAELE